ncbi:MAG: alpha/beta hydrolase [Actinobacteria bacterium]|nr:alpha/beta hydrolase [Actinomycetota bacterium]
MVTQMRNVLNEYQAKDGSYREVVLTDCGHSPHLEKPAEFAWELRTVLGH